MSMPNISINSSDTPSSSNTSMAAPGEENDKPLMNLFKRLIGNDSKQNTVLTNAQIVDILKKEFCMDISYIHELEVEIYLNLMKKFLKDWPQWDAFDRSIHSIKAVKEEKVDNQSREQIELEANYENLKVYLSKMLGTAKPLIKKAVDEVKATANKDNPNDNDFGVVLEVNCTREQLEGLFYRRAHPDYNNTIFNLQPLPSKITHYTHSFKSMMNWPNVKITANFGQIVFTREMSTVTKRRLVNKKLNKWRAEHKELDTRLQMKESSIQTGHNMHTFFKILKKSQTFTPNSIFLASCLVELLKKDFTCGVPLSDMPITQTPSQFRRTLSKYPYVRYLYSDVQTKNPEKITANTFAYDLQLEETYVPQVLFGITKFLKQPVKCGAVWIQVKCTECNVNMVDDDMKVHFENCHQKEKDWECSNCNQSFPMVQLCEDGWAHECKAGEVPSA